VRQLSTALSLAKTDLAAARVERDKALGDAERTKVSANDLLRTLQKEVSDERGARELLNTKMMLAKKEAEEMRAARDADKTRVLQLEKVHTHTHIHTHTHTHAFKERERER